MCAACIVLIIHLIVRLIQKPLMPFLFRQMIRKPDDGIGVALIAISSLLLGIWATVGTIALRNIGLMAGTLIAMVYLVRWVRLLNLNKARQPHSECLWIRWAPLVLIIAMLFWMFIHYLFFSQFPERQWAELRSTCLRAALGSLVGLATGLALQRHRNLTWLLWLGLFVSFLVLFYQYIPKAITNQSFFATDFFGNYIYWAKFNGVLAGLILLAGLLGLVIDRSWEKSNSPKCDASLTQSRWPSYALVVYALAGICLALYGFVFIFDAKNGIGVAGILFVCWLIIGGFWALRSCITKRKDSVRIPHLGRYLLAYGLVIIIFLGLGWQQVKNNPGWESLVEDIGISMQIDRYTHWHDPGKYGYPLRPNGETVRGNTYERVAWGIVGLQLIGENPLGTGVFRALTEQMRAKNIEFTSSPYTHSAWIDLGLTFGIPGLVLMPLVFSILLGQSLINKSQYFRGTIISLSITMMVLYTVGEYAFQHGIEILFFIGALLAGIGLSMRSHPA